VSPDRGGSGAAGRTGAPLRVLHLHSGNLYGGVETILATIARHRGDAASVDHAFALCFAGRCADELAAAGVGLTILGQARVRTPWTVLAARRRLRDLLAAERPDVAVTHSPWAHALFAPVVRRAGIPLVHWRHGASDGRHWLERWAGRTPPDLVIAPSRFVAASIDLLLPGVRTEVLHPPLELAAAPREAGATAGKHRLRDDMRASLGTPLDVAVVAQVSRMEAGKGHAILIDALSALGGRGDWECWVVGRAQRPEEAAYEHGLQHRVAAVGLAGRIRFLGERDDVPSLLGAGDLLCQPSTSAEAFGVVFVEALAQGIPVVTTAIGAASEVLDASCGVLVPPGDAVALAEALRSLLDDPARRAALGAAGPGRAALLCDPARQLAHLGDLLRTVAGRELRAPEGRIR